MLKKFFGVTVLAVLVGLFFKQPARTDPQAEIVPWKHELLAQKLLGAPCTFEGLASPEAARWRQENPGQHHGWPSADSAIGTARSDFDGDGQADWLFYFNSQNCSGRNGDTPWFAKIVHANGAVNAQLVSDVREAVFQAYEDMRSDRPSLQPVTRDYADEAISVGYAGQISGLFRLYATDDAHCCPTHQGTYTYDPRSGKARLNFKN